MLGALGTDVLKAEIVDAVIAGVFEAMQPAHPHDHTTAIGVELTTIEREIGRLAEAIAMGGELAPLVTLLQSKQARRDELLANRARVVDHRPFNRRKVQTAVRERLQDWRGLLSRNVAEGRQLLREILAGPIRFTPENGAYRIEGEADFGQLLATAGVPPYMASPTGFEPVF